MLSRDLFLIDPDVVFFNNGSFGACPKPVFAEYQRWQLELERQPVEFLGRRLPGLLREAREKTAPMLNLTADDFVFVMNTTEGMNVVARWLMLEHLKPGDEILTTDQEYGATNNMWDFACKYTGAIYKKVPITLPVTTPEEFVEEIWAQVTPRTKVLFLSHLTSATALIFPVKELCERARAAGIITVVDGAHAPGQISPLDIPALGADFYSGNFHKWVCSPKGSAFLYAHPTYQAALEPILISHGWPGGWPGVEDGVFPARHQLQGTGDFAAWLSVPSAIEFMAEHDWDAQRAESMQLVSRAYEEMQAWTELEGLSPNSPTWLAQMVTCPLPPCDVNVVKARLYDECRIEIPVYEFQGQPYLRFSFQAYNSAADLETTLRALRHVVGR